MNEILYLAKNRLEFTKKTFETMLANTNWTKIHRVVVYDDGSVDGTREYLTDQLLRSDLPASFVGRITDGIGPVGIMIDYISRRTADGIFVKLDNDVMVPPHWLEEGLDLLARDRSIDLLGIEAMKPIGEGLRGFARSEYIGGIGFMRLRAFEASVPVPRGRFGFTKWQTSHPSINKGWIDPSLRVCLLNLVPFDPWASLSRQYIRNGWQRDWPEAYSSDRSDLWSWWAE